MPYAISYMLLIRLDTAIRTNNRAHSAGNTFAVILKLHKINAPLIKLIAYADQALRTKLNA